MNIISRIGLDYLPHIQLVIPHLLPLPTMLNAIHHAATLGLPSSTTELFTGLRWHNRVVSAAQMALRQIL